MGSCRGRELTGGSVCSRWHAGLRTRPLRPGSAGGCQLHQAGRGLWQAHVIEARVDFRCLEASDRVGCQVRDTLDAGLLSAENSFALVQSKSPECATGSVRTNFPDDTSISVSCALALPPMKARFVSGSKAMAFLPTGKVKKGESAPESDKRLSPLRTGPAISSYGPVRPRRRTCRGSWRSCPRKRTSGC